VLYACSGADNYFLWITLCGYITFSILVKGKYKLPRIKISIKSFPQIGITKTILVFVFVIISLTFSKVGLGGVNFDTSAVYEFRKSAKDLLPVYLLYLLSWASKVMIPFCIAISLKHKRYFYAFISMLFGILLFSVTGNKSTLFLAMLIPFLYFFAKSIVARPQAAFLFIVLAINIALIASFLDFYTEDRPDQNLIGTLFFRRFLLIPALLNSFYIETFGTSDSFGYFSDKIPKFLGISPTNRSSIPNIIGYRYFNNIDSNANTGWIGSGYAQAGFYGVLFYSIILAFFCKIGDFFAIKHGLPICLCVLAGPSLAMIASSDTLTGLLTNGGIFGLIILLIMPKQDKSDWNQRL